MILKPDALDTTQAVVKALEKKIRKLERTRGNELENYKIEAAAILKKRDAVIASMERRLAAMTQREAASHSTLANLSRHFLQEYSMTEAPRWLYHLNDPVLAQVCTTHNTNLHAQR